MRCRSLHGQGNCARLDKKCWTNRMHAMVDSRAMSEPILTAAEPRRLLMSALSTKSHKRRSKYERWLVRPDMVLTERDKEILRQINAFRLMTTAQIERLLFKPSLRSICARRLR